MPRKTVGYVQLVWRCPNCSQANPGPQKTCATCGAPQPEGVAFENAPQGELLTDQAASEKVKKGADLHCPYCGTRNPADAKICSQCNGDLTGGKQRQAGNVVGAFNPEPAGSVTCPTCGTSNPSGNTRCSSCNGPLLPPPAQAAQPVPPASVTPASPRRKVGLAILLILLGLVCVAAIIFLTRTSEITGTVTDLAWNRTLEIEQLQPVSRSDWKESIPADAQVGSCEQRLNRTQDQPEGNFKEVCGTPYTVDTGTGLGEVVQDCQYEIYMDYCSYTAQDWVVVNTVEQTGQGNQPYWPDPSLTSTQRQGGRSETYTITFDTEKGPMDYSTHELVVYNNFSLGSTWILEINSFGNISGFQPK